MAAARPAGRSWRTGGARVRPRRPSVSRGATGAAPEEQVAERPDGRAEDDRGGAPSDVDFAKLNGWDRDWETFSDYDLPTYVGPTTFMNLPWIEDPAELRARNVDVAIVGAPFDDAVSHRPGARFGPRAIREAQYTSGSIHSLQLGVEPFERPDRRRRRRREHRPGLDRAGPRPHPPEGPRRGGDRRDPDRPRRRPLDHLAVARPPSPRSAGPARSGSSTSTPTPTPPNDDWGVLGQPRHADAPPDRDRAPSAAGTSSRSGCAATGRRSRRSSGCRPTACAGTS